MEINNNPSLSLVPVILGEIKRSRISSVESADAEKKDDSPQLLTRVVSEAEKEAAQQQLFAQNDQNQNQQNLQRDQATLSESKAIDAYQQNEQSEQTDYLSRVLGIDVTA